MRLSDTFGDHLVIFGSNFKGVEEFHMMYDVYEYGAGKF